MKGIRTAPLALVIVTLDTPSWSFLAAGTTEVEARAALATGWALHCQQTGADPTYVNPAEDGNATELAPGDCYRDDTLLCVKEDDDLDEEGL